VAVLACLGICVTAARPTLDNWCCPATTGVGQRVLSGLSTGPEQLHAPPGEGLAYLRPGSRTRMVDSGGGFGRRRHGEWVTSLLAGPN
jgi:hypothetical protein